MLPAPAGLEPPQPQPTEKPLYPAPLIVLCDRMGEYRYLHRHTRQLGTHTTRRHLVISHRKDQLVTTTCPSRDTRTFKKENPTLSSNQYTRKQRNHAATGCVVILPAVKRRRAREFKRHVRGSVVLYDRVRVPISGVSGASRLHGTQHSHPQSHSISTLKPQLHLSEHGYTHTAK